MNWKILLTLSCFYVVYVILGGVVFHFIESPQEQTTKVDIRSFRDKFLRKFTCISSTDLDLLLSRVIRAYDSGVKMTNQTTADNWDIASSVFFSITVVTTIGYGHISPSTIVGKAFCIVYALIGIPITAVMLAGIGQNLWDRMERTSKLARCQQKVKMWKTIRNVAFAVGGVVFLMIIPASIFMAVEGWDWGSAFYYTFVTLSTIGFGDYVAEGLTDTSFRGMYRVMVGVWIVLGLAWLSTVISIVQDLFSEKMEKAVDKFETKHKIWFDKSNTYEYTDAEYRKADMKEINLSRSGIGRSSKNSVTPTEKTKPGFYTTDVTIL